MGETELQKCIEAEREAVRLAELWRATPHRHIGTEKVADARAATDEAVKAVEALLGAIDTLALAWAHFVADDGDSRIETAVACSAVFAAAHPLRFTQATTGGASDD